VTSYVQLAVIGAVLVIAIHWIGTWHAVRTYEAAMRRGSVRDQVAVDFERQPTDEIEVVE